MSTLSGTEIKRLIDERKIRIEPFYEDQLNPNSYNLRLKNKLLVYKLNHSMHVPEMANVPRGPQREVRYLDMAEPLEACEITIPPQGFILMPGVLYLGTTAEYTETPGYVPVLEGRSSIGRLGLCIHVTAGFGDNGFAGHWTLEITVVHPVKIYPDIEICQIAYSTLVGTDEMRYMGKYQGQEGKPRASEFYKDFAKPKLRYDGLTYQERWGLCPKDDSISMESRPGPTS